MNFLKRGEAHPLAVLQSLARDFVSRLGTSPVLLAMLFQWAAPRYRGAHCVVVAAVAVAAVAVAAVAVAAVAVAAVAVAAVAVAAVAVAAVVVVALVVSMAGLI